jgi:hypothetical protein
MGVIVELFVDAGRVALGLTAFSWLLWAYVSALLLVVGPVFVQVAPKVVDPPARLVATDPLRVAMWMPLSILVLFAATVLLFITVFGAVLAPLLALLLCMAGYLAISRLLGERILHAVLGGDVPPWAAAMVGIALLRLLRIVPVVGGAAHSLVAWVGLAAATCAAWRMTRQHWRRRLPDRVQFRGETLVEWYPDGDPVDGVPSVGTGRPVLDNVRGDEDRNRPSGDA